MNRQRHKQYCLAFLRSVGIQQAEYPNGIPESVYQDLKRRGLELGINIDKDLETPLKRAEDPRHSDGCCPVCGENDGRCDHATQDFIVPGE
jgi:hypothetical protein